MKKLEPGRNPASWIKPVLIVVACTLLILSASRLGLSIWQWGRVEATQGFGFILLQGLRFDLVTIGLLLGLPVAVTPLALAIPGIRDAWPAILRVYSILVIALVLFMELATPAFVAEYDMRPDILFVEYLSHPGEVFSMLWAAYKPGLFVLAGVMLVILPLVATLSRGAFSRMQATPPLLAILMTPLLLVLSVGMVRSTLGHRPVNPSTAAFSSDPLINTLALNSSYSLLYALYELRYEDGFAYGAVKTAKIIRQTRESMYLAPDQFANDEIPTSHHQNAVYHFSRPRNLVIVLEESLGAEFVGRLGGLPLTPNLDELAEQGMWFENLYATGTRSVRGIEAVVTGFPPSTSLSVVKLGRSQRNFATIAQILGQAGYDTSFIYGGNAQFDNMGRFFSNNGFDSIIDKDDYADPVYSGSWGVSDEDLFNKAAQIFDRQPADQPFFSLIFSSSNHSPYGFPDGRIEPFEEPAATVNNAVKYADHALGRFIAKARESDYWDNTVFLIVADHNSRVYGAELVPIERFHIPGLILGSGIEPTRVTRIASQIDLLPTLLSLVGVTSTHPAMGLDLTRADINAIPGRAIMQYGPNQAYMEGNKVVVLRKGIAAQQYDYDGTQLTLGVGSSGLIDKAVTLAAWPSLAYQNGLHRLPAEVPTSILSQNKQAGAATITGGGR